jgi:sulfur-oxidizing protein SoxY
MHRGVSRRFVLAAGAVGPVFLAFAEAARATPDSARELLGKLAQGEPRPGRVALKAPEIAENGNTVPVTISVESPMTAADHVKAVHLVADGNPQPGVASFRFGPASGKAEVQLRMRMARTQSIVAVAEMSDGSLWSATREVKVTIGGCGG